MITASTTTTLSAPAADVYADLTGTPTRWIDLFPLSVTWPDGPPSSLAEGATFRQTLGYLGIADTVVTTVQINRPDRIEMLSAGNHGADCCVRLNLDELPSGDTRLSIDVEILGRLIGPVAFIARRQLQHKLTTAITQFATTFVQRNPHGSNGTVR